MPSKANFGGDPWPGQRCLGQAPSGAAETFGPAAPSLHPEAAAAANGRCPAWQRPAANTVSRGSAVAAIGRRAAARSSARAEAANEAQNAAVQPPVCPHCTAAAVTMAMTLAWDKKLGILSSLEFIQVNPVLRDNHILPLQFQIQ